MLQRPTDPPDHGDLRCLQCDIVFEHARTQLDAECETSRTAQADTGWCVTCCNASFDGCEDCLSIVCCFLEAAS